MWKLIHPPSGTVAPTAAVDIAALEALKKKALTLIVLSVRDNVIPHIVNITDPTQCSKVLKDMYANMSNSRKVMLRRKLANLKMEETTPMSIFFQQLKELVNKFASAGENINEAELVEHVLMALPSSFEGLITTIMYQSKLLTLSKLTVTLLQEDTRRELRGTKRSDHEVLQLKGQYSLRKISNGGDHNTKQPPKKTWRRLSLLWKQRALDA